MMSYAIEQQGNEKIIFYTAEECDTLIKEIIKTKANLVPVCYALKGIFAVNVEDLKVAKGKIIATRTKAGEKVVYNFLEEESDRTKQLLCVSYLVIKSLKEGRHLALNSVRAFLPPQILYKIESMYNDCLINKSKVHVMYS